MIGKIKSGLRKIKNTVKKHWKKGLAVVGVLVVSVMAYGYHKDALEDSYERGYDEAYDLYDEYYDKLASRYTDRVADIIKLVRNDLSVVGLIEEASPEVEIIIHDTDSKDIEFAEPLCGYSMRLWVDNGGDE